MRQEPFKLSIKVALGFLYAFLTFFSVNAQHCKHHFEGEVQDAEGSPIAFAGLYIPDLQIGIQADSSGFFHYHHICKQNYVVLVSAVGYKQGRFEVRIPYEAPLVYRLELDSANLLEEVEVRYSKRFLMSASSELLRGYEIDKKSGQSLAEMISGLSGVSSLKTGANIQKPVIHGLHSNRVLILNNGIRHESQQWGSEHAPEIDPTFAQKLTVLKGAMAMRYGSDAIGGVVLVEPAPMPLSKHLSGFVNVGAASNGGMHTATLQMQKHSGKVNGLAWRAHGSFRRSGNLHTPDYLLGNTGTREYNAAFALRKTFKKAALDVFYSIFSTQIGILSAAHIGNLTDLYEAIQRSQPLDTASFSYKIHNPKQDVQHHLLKLRYEKTMPVGNLEVVYAFQYNKRQEYDKHKPRGSRGNRPAVDYDLFTNLAEFVFLPKLKSKAWTVQTGLQAWLQYNFYTGGQPIVPDFVQHNSAVFASTRYEKNDWALELGLRGDLRYAKTFQSRRDSSFSNEFLYQNPAFNASLTRHLGTWGQIAASYTSAWRPPSMNELFSDGVHHGSAAYEKGDINLKPERAHNFSLDYTFQGKYFSFHSSFFYNKITDFIYLKPQFPAILTIRGAFPAFAHTQTSVFMRGVDAEATVPYREWKYKVQASYLRVTDKNSQYLVGIMPNRLTHGLAYEAEREGKKICLVQVEIRQTWVAAQRDVPPNSDYSPPPKAFMLWEAELGCFFWLKNQEFKLALSVQNALNMRYRDYMNRLRYYADETGRNVSLRLKIPF